MSLNRFTNRELLLSINEPQYGQLWTDKDLSVLNDMILIPADPNIVADHRSELHIYSFYGDSLLSNHDSTYAIFEKLTNSLLIDIRTTFKEANIDRGSYLVVINLFKDIWGRFSQEPVVLREISPDGTELKLSIDRKYIDQYPSFQADIQNLVQNNILNNLVVNFGYNNIGKVVNVWFDGDGQTIYLKLYRSIDGVEIKDKAWFSFEVIDPYFDTVVLAPPVRSSNVFDVGGPNFLYDTSQNQSSATSYKNWDEVLDANLSTRQRIIEQALSGSVNVKLNIDFTDFNNFVFYSSAEERARNFHYKVSKIEEYSSSIAILFNSTASNTSFISGSVDLNRRRIDQITSNFDPWERWLYFESTASLFTHDITGSITPWPKRIVSGSWLNYTISSSIVQNWYDTLIVSASDYDQRNNNRLYWSIPEHIYMDPNNSDFVTFVDMVGEHFDVLYAYITSMTQIHSRDEHPQRGAPNELLYHIAKSFGWNLQNTRQLADLWNYKLGSDSSGSYASTGSMFSISHEDQTHQIWKRIVNNLPYLFKTKGAGRSVKALLSIYGIPQTLISIKEYGGPSRKSDSPVWIDDRFKYEANFTGSNYIELNRRIVPASSGSWTGVARTPDTVEFSFRTTYSSSVSMSMWAIEDGGNRSQVLANVQAVHKQYFDGTASYSGSNAYGKLRLDVPRWVSSTNTVFSGQPVTGLTDYLPIFDGDVWTVKLSTNQVFTQSQTSLQRITLTVAKASDCFAGRISHSGSTFVQVTAGSTNFTYPWGAGSGSVNTPHITLIGGTTGSIATASSARFVGQISSYKEYFTTYSDTTYLSHVMNPAAYHDDVDTGSFYTLYRYFPLGIDQQRWDHSTYVNVSSSQPNRRASFDTTASFKNWTGSESDQYISFNESYYIQTPTLGGNLLRSTKIRTETSQLAFDLNPNNRSDVGAYDYDGYDSNRLAIVFAPSDHVNFDIFNQTGFQELDDYIGDPEYEFEDEYVDLKRFQGQYLKKYVNPYNVNALIKVLALYDYTFFEQVKQLIPAKADAILGVLIESDVLARPKVRMMRRPSIEELGQETAVDLTIISSSGDNLTYETTASSNVYAASRYDYLTSSFHQNVYATSSYNYYTSSLDQLVFLTGSCGSHFNSGSRDYLGDVIDTVPSRFSGSQTETQSYVDNYRLNCCYKRVIYHYSASGTFATEYERQWRTAVSMSYGMHYSRSLECTSYQYAEECAVENRWRFGGSKLVGADINVNSPNTIDGGPVVTVWESNPNTLKNYDSPLGGNLIVE